MKCEGVWEAQLSAGNRRDQPKDHNLRVAAGVKNVGGCVCLSHQHNALHITCMTCKLMCCQGVMKRVI
jgi:hypothetical protein